MSLESLGFALRSGLSWSAPPLKRLASLERVTAELEPAGRARLAVLKDRFDLSSWPKLCSLQEWRESLYVLDVLSMHLEGALPEGRGLDVGAKNGCTLPGLAAFSPRGWDAVELDAHRRTLWGSTRRVYGEALARRLTGCRFIAGSILAEPGPWALITWFLPFLTPGPHQAWGLPARLFEPDRLLRHVLDRLLPGGRLLIVNQGREEHALQGRLLEQAGARATSLGRLDSPLSPFCRERFAFLIR